MIIEPVSIITFFITAILVSLTLVIFLGSKEYSSRIFSLFTFFVALWVMFRGVYHSVPETHSLLATLANDLSFSTGIIIASLFLYFSLVFPENKKPRDGIVLLLIAINILLLPVYFCKDLFLGHTVYVGEIQQWTWGQGPLLPIYDLFFAGLWVTGLIVLFYKSKKYTGTVRRNLRFMFWSIFIGIIPVEFASLLLPRIFNNFNLEWTSSITMVGWTSLLAYTIVRHNQMNVRTVLTELLVLAAIFILFLNIFI